MNSLLEIPLTEDRIIELQITIFGSIRVTSRLKKSMYLDINWCAGPKLEHINYLLSKVRGAFESGKHIKSFSKVKPYFKDPEFCEYLESLSTDESIKVTAEQITELRVKLLQHFASQQTAVLFPVNYEVEPVQQPQKKITYTNFERVYEWERIDLTEIPQTIGSDFENLNIIKNFTEKLLENMEDLDDEILEALETTFWDLI